MSCRIISKKVDDGQLVGYLLEQEGLRFIVELRDLYEQEILDSLIEAGYQYHDYYGDITTNTGISINELSAEPITSDDNLSFKGAFAQSALTEQQCLRYFRTNMANIIQVNFREPAKILIHNRQELMAYLKRWKRESNSRVTGEDRYPLNAICAKEALFTPDEIETDNSVREAFQWMQNRRRYPTYETVQRIEDFFISEGLMTEDERGDIDVFISSYAAWGPEGINAPCIGSKMEYDVIYPIGAPYTGTGREKLTFESIRAALRADVKDDILSKIKYRISLGIMDKEGCITSNGTKVDRGDIIEHEGDIVLSQDMMKRYTELSRSVGKWETPYRAISVIDIMHRNRMVLTLQTAEGRLYEWRADKENVALVNTTSSLLVQPLATVNTVDGEVVRIDRIYTKDGYAKYTMFHGIASEVIDLRRILPAYKSTSELCVKNGLHAEQALDYIQFMSGRPEATSILHYGLDDVFMKKFGPGADDMGEDSDFLDVLDIINTKYNDALNAEGDDHFDYAEVLENILDPSYSPEEKKLAMYINNVKPNEKINAILDFNSDKIALEQLTGRNRDDRNSNKERVYNGLQALYSIVSGNVIDSTNMGFFLQDVLNEKYIKLDDLVPYLNAEAHACLLDYAKLRYKQITEVQTSIWVTSVIGEYSAAPVNERRHVGFAGVQMKLNKGTRMRKLVDALIKSVQSQMHTSGLYSDKDKLAYGWVMSRHILEFLWEIKIGNIALDNNNGMFSKTYVQKTKYENVSVAVKLEIGESDYHYIKSPNCPDFDFALSTISIYCKNSTISVANSYKFDSMLMNVNISPWRISKREGFEDVPVYNGCLNLISNNQWEMYFKQNLPHVYEGVLREGGRVDINPYDYDNTYAIYPINSIDSTSAGILFAQINKENGRSGNDLPIEYNNYYLESDKEESFRRYMQRINNTLSIIAKNEPGKKFYREPLKSDVYYKNIAPYYGEEVLSGYETVDVTYEGVASKPYCPINTEGFSSKLIGTSKGEINVIPIGNSKLSVNKLLRCNKLVRNGFAPKFDCYVGNGNIFVMDKERTTIELSKLTADDLIKYASVGLCYQITTNEFLFYGINGTFILEVR